MNPEAVARFYVNVFGFKEEEKALEDPNFYLTDGTVTIKTGINESASEIQLTNRDLREKERPSVLARWIQKIL